LKFDESGRSKVSDRQAYQVECFPGDLAALLQAGLKALRAPLEGIHDDDDAVIS
jgi:hypothetical protein